MSLSKIYCKGCGMSLTAQTSRRHEICELCEYGTYDVKKRSRDVKTSLGI